MGFQALVESCSRNHRAGSSLWAPRRATTTPAAARAQHGGAESPLRFERWMLADHSRLLSCNPGELSRDSSGGTRVDEADWSLRLGGTKLPLEPAAGRC
jgi:hypothetical protein